MTLALYQRDWQTFLYFPPEKSKSKRSSSKGARVITDNSQVPGTSSSKSCNKKSTSSGSKSDKRKKPSTQTKRNSKKQKQTTENNDTDEIYLDDGICDVCMLNSRLEWFGCDLCTRWYHYVCLPHSVQTEVDFSIVTSSVWKCVNCLEE